MILILMNLYYILNEHDVDNDDYVDNNYVLLSHSLTPYYLESWHIVLSHASPTSCINTGGGTLLGQLQLIIVLMKMAPCRINFFSSEKIQLIFYFILKHLIIKCEIKLNLYLHFYFYVYLTIFVLLLVFAYVIILC